MLYERKGRQDEASMKLYRKRMLNPRLGVIKNTMIEKASCLDPIPEIISTQAESFRVEFPLY